MGLETATYISGLNSLNPTGGDDRSTADDHMRLIKSTILATFPNISGAMTCTHTELNQLDGYTAGRLEVAGTWTRQQAFGIQTLSDGASIAWDLATNQVAQVTLGGNRTLANPTNIINGGFYTLFVVQDGTGSRTLSYGANYYWQTGVAPTLSTGANAVDILGFVARGGYMYGNFLGNFS